MTTQKDLPNDFIDSLLSNYKKPEDLIGMNGRLKQLTKALVERGLQAEMTENLGHNKYEPVTNIAGNARNGKSQKTLKGEFGELSIEIPRDLEGSNTDEAHKTRRIWFNKRMRVELAACVAANKPKHKTQNTTAFLYTTHQKIYWKYTDTHY